MTIQLQNFSSETIYVQDMLFTTKGITTNVFLQTFFNSVIYETFPNLKLFTYMILLIIGTVWGNFWGGLSCLFTAGLKCFLF